MKRINLLLAAAFIVLHAATDFAQLNKKAVSTSSPTEKATAKVERVSEAQAREWAVAAAKSARGLVDVFCRQFDRLASEVIPGFRQDHVAVNFSNAGDNQVLRYVNASAQGQLQAFEWMSAEAARRGTPIGDVLWPKGPVVWITVNDDESPVVERVIVRRGDAIVEATENYIELNHSRGKDVDSYEGWVSFPADAFASTKDKVQIDLVPKPSKYGNRNGVTRLTAKSMDQLFRF